MAKIAKTAATKSRETKLGKKNVEELIQIILKKDKVESKLNAQINALKTENKALQNRVNSFDKDQEGNVKAIAESKDRVKTLNESLNASRLKIEELDHDVQKYAMAAADANDKVSGLKVLLIVSTMFAVVFGIALLF